ncbi:replication protein [Bacillus phage vB_BpsM-61]|nr:replication protein [Bacillus phage vB_BpsM-61]
MTDLYPDYETLAANEVKGVDYDVRTYPVKGSKILAIAPHGGGIEPGSSELVQGLHERFKFSGYDFDALKSSDNWQLHITSVNFNEPEAIRMNKDMFSSIALHGYSGESSNTYVGGLDHEMREIVTTELRNAGFTVSNDPPIGIAGLGATNIVNRNRRGKGVQLELSTAQRRSFFKDGNISRSNRINRVQAFYDYVNALGKAMMKGHRFAPTRMIEHNRILYK